MSFFINSQYPQLDNYILNELNLLPEDYDSFEDFLNAIKEEFDKSYGIITDGVIESASFIWDSKFVEPEPEPEKPKPKPKEKPKEVKLTQAQETDIQNVVQNEDLTKREVSIRTLEIVNKPFSLQQFYDETGMVQSTARRELGQAVKRGEIERVSRGVYRRL